MSIERADFESAKKNGPFEPFSLEPGNRQTNSPTFAATASCTERLVTKLCATWMSLWN